MKKIYILTLAAILATGCKKNQLDTAPYSTVATANMWTTDNLTDLGVAGAYNALRLGLNTGGDSGEELYMLDRFGFTGQNRNQQSLLSATETTGDGLFSSVWSHLYEGIQRCNDVIVNMPLKSPSADTKKARYVAEGKFLRAYYYLRLNQVFKGVPIYLKPYTPDQATEARSSETEVWNQVVTDLTDAINEPNLPDIYNAGDANYGHATKGAAYALRGKAYMYMKKWDLAAADFAQVKAKGYALYSNYVQLFKTANEQCKEMIFSIQNVSVVNDGSTTQWFCGTRSSFGSCWNDYLVSPNLVDLYQNADGSTFKWDDVIPGYSSLAPAQREVYFLRNNLTAAEITAATVRGAKMDLYLPTGNEERILKAYANRDPRLVANVITPYSIYNGVYNNVNAACVSRWPYRSAGPDNADLQTDTQSQFYYLYRKFVYEGNSEIIGRNYGPTDFPLIRYADVLLMWAEALNEAGQTDEAISKVNEVRARAGVGLLNSSAATAVAGQDDLRNRIRDERRMEFPNEGINYFDELRWQTWKDKVFYPGNGTKQVWGANVYTYTYQGDYTNSWPIPLVETQRNPNLKQTPGWTN
ncbi:RagB/SusD family nutrient uptake outer membrane protein [Mucilaginibacter sp. SMC90]|uniref:RagB/SusD family nutrient uptake outer membrane protein n=1 Tax=Mucilaginibacter sp. SMC90 TaxID=2929803 RepID=UPI001FB4F8F3|nr:RagB/SusD family nutrient uptake outer membrane protein [Mucilaginibacter sp. SMC90]UOE47244.1 RagB/SusD family nutrient uptake outer membrane protein [Mucilaginibacter sp. SMC90]